MPDDNRRLVWDLPLRMFHWLLALSIFLCWGTAKAGFGWMKWHFFLGYWVTGLLIFRLIWGFLGPRHARFSSFLKGPGSVIAYARTLARAGAGYRIAGHNPLGALMVILMLLLVTLQAATGLFSTDDIAWSGPYNPSVSGAIASQLTRIHHLNFNLIWGAIGLHLAAIIYYTAFKKEPLIPAMWTGKKRVEAIPDGEWIHGSALLRAVGVVAVSSFVVYLILHGAPAQY